jgi:Mrp family chromosome partitioning ATPase/capsular polysaccharide biosynthesis protein
MPDSPHKSDATLAYYIRVVRRRRWVVLQALLLVPLIAVLYALSQQAQYRATADVLINRQNLASALTGTIDPNLNAQADRTAQTQARLANEPEVARRTLKAVGLNRSPDSLLAHSSVAAASNADLLRFSVTDHSPRLAIALAGAYAHQYTRYREQLDTAALQRARAGVDAKIKQLEANGRRKDALYASLASSSQQLGTMEALQTSNATVVRTPDSAARAEPQPVRAGIVGIVLGIALGLGVAFLWEALDTRVRSSEEIEERLGVPLLARLREPPRKFSRTERLVMLDDPRGPESEAFHMLRMNLEFARLGRETRTIMVTSSVEQEGKSTTISNLAVALARTGQSVVLVDLDLRRPSLHRFFGILDRPAGLTQVAIGDVPLEAALIPIELSDDRELAEIAPGLGVPPRDTTAGLHLLTAGLSPPNPGEFVTSHAVDRILVQLQTQFDTVLIDTPPALHVVDAIALSARVDAMILVTRMRVVRRPMLNELHRLLESVSAAKLGFVLTGASAQASYGLSYSGYSGEHVGDSARTHRVA